MTTKKALYGWSGNHKQLKDVNAMIFELKALKKQFSINQLANFYAQQFFSRVADDQKAENEIAAILKSNVERYSQISEIKRHSGDFGQQLTTIITLFPTFIFVICNELDKYEEYQHYSRFLRISATATIISRKTDKQTNVILFLKQIDPTNGLNEMNERISDLNQDLSYFPKIVYQDFKLLEQNKPSFPTSKDPLELIEMLYYFKGIKQVFLKQFFNLICRSPNDVISQHIYDMFNKLFFPLRFQEAEYWKKYKDGAKLRKQLLHTIAIDSERTRHPELRKHVFENIKYYNPIIQDGSIRNMSEEIRKYLAKQLAAFHALSIQQLILLLDITQKSKGNSFVSYLLMHLVRTDNEKLFELNDKLHQSADESTKVLRQTIIAFTKRFPRSKDRSAFLKKLEMTTMNTVYKTADSLRQLHANKKLAATKGARGMTHEHVTRFLEDRLKKLYERVKIEGALTYDKIPEYLKKFAVAAESVVSPIDIGKEREVAELFKASTDEILQEISERGQLTTDEIEVFQSSIDEKAEGLDSSDIDERTDIVDEIGVTLTEASFESDKRKGEKEREAFLKRNIIPYGLDKKAKRITIGEFFLFPFGDFKGPEEDDWFNYHMRYLQLAVKKNKLDKSNFVKIFNILQYLPKIKYRKYFNIFPNDQFEETTFMAVYDLWQNKAFDKLKITP